MRIQVGGYYRTRNGFIQGPMSESVGDRFKAQSDMKWDATGKAQKPAGAMSDLVEECVVIASAEMPIMDASEAQGDDALLELAAEHATVMSESGNLYVFTPKGLSVLLNQLQAAIEPENAEPAEYQTSEGDQLRIEGLKKQLDEMTLRAENAENALVGVQKADVTPRLRSLWKNKGADGGAIYRFDGANNGHYVYHMVGTHGQPLVTSPELFFGTLEQIED